MEEIIKQLNESSLIRKKELSDGIVSYNFTRKAFFDAEWNNLTTTARGLFIRGDKIVARSYNKFFRLNETNETMDRNLEKNLVFPVKCYLKENGYLGIVSFDVETNKWFISSKSSNESDYAKHLDEMIKPYLTNELANELTKLNSTMVFEVIDTDFDPHIINYESKSLILLDVIKNDFNFTKMSYEDLKLFGEKHQFIVKKELTIIDSYDKLMEFIEEVKKYEEYEGLVIEDLTGFMFKVKTDYYSFWKMVRSKLLTDIEEVRKSFPQYSDIIDKLKTIDIEQYKVENYQKVDILKLQKTIYSM